MTGFSERLKSKMVVILLNVLRKAHIKYIYYAKILPVKIVKIIISYIKCILIYLYVIIYVCIVYIVIMRWYEVDDELCLFGVRHVLLRVSISLAYWVFCGSTLVIIQPTQESLHTIKNGERRYLWWV